ncbi:hypothetical protein LA080_011714 [Diaporthe eres]|nr:hypothetical protein LA080_011714 [Diaporthe eres]
MLFDLIIPGPGTTITGLLHLGLAVARTGESKGIAQEFRRAYTACLESISGAFNPVLDDNYVWFTLVDSDAMGHFGDSLLRHLPDAGSNAERQRWYCDEISPPWFGIQIPEIGNAHLAGSGRADSFPWLMFQLLGPNRGYKLHGLVEFKGWLPCAQEPKEIQMPVRAKMPLKNIVEAFRETRLHWRLRYLLAVSEKVSEDAESILERRPQPEDSNVYSNEWRTKSLVDELGFFWRNEMVTFV